MPIATPGKANSRGSGLSTTPNGHEEAIERAVAFQDQHPREGAHQNADPQRQHDAGEDDGAPAEARAASAPRREQSRSRGSRPIRQAPRTTRVLEHKAIDVDRREFAVGGERTGRRRDAQDREADAAARRKPVAMIAMAGASSSAATATRAVRSRPAALIDRRSRRISRAAL